MTTSTILQSNCQIRVMQQYSVVAVTNRVTRKHIRLDFPQVVREKLFFFFCQMCEYLKIFSFLVITRVISFRGEEFKRLK